MQFKKIVSHHKNLVYNQAYYFTGNKEDAKDITQEVLIKLWHHLSNIKRASLKAWLLKVTRNLCIDYSRRTKKIILNNFDDDKHQLGIVETLIDPNSNPEEEAINKDLIENISRIINNMPEKIRSIVIMRDIQDLKYKVIAETMGLPLNSVKAYLHRGRKLLLKNLLIYSKHDFQPE